MSAPGSASTHLDKVFAALADPTRRAILNRLAREGSASVGEIAEPFAMSLPAVSKHLKILERAGLISRRVEGRVHRCTFDAAPLDAAESWIAHHRAFWEQQFDNLERYLRETPDEGEGS